MPRVRANHLPTRVHKTVRVHKDAEVRRRQPVRRHLPAAAHMQWHQQTAFGQTSCQPASGQHLGVTELAGLHWLPKFLPDSCTLVITP